ncbi:MAG: radical SAM protein, partial [Elusimicrobia bacterium]|nr:radical SAM protein [Elusimicrobiota bacterium]
MRGGAAGDYRAPLFFAWQLTNRCGCRCLHCCEESGPDRAWPEELTRKECLRIAGDLVACGIPYVAFGGGEPFGAKHVWEVLGVLRRGGVCVKIETTGEAIDAKAAAALARLGVASIQISLDGPSAAAHRALRPGADFDAAVAALRRL